MPINPATCSAVGLCKNGGFPDCKNLVSRIEIMSDSSTKQLFRMIYLGVGFSFLLMMVEVSLRHTGHFENETDRQRVAIFNVAISAISCVGLVAGTAHYVWRLFKIGFWHLRWCPRRRKWTIIRLASLIFHHFNVLIFFLTNVLYLTRGEDGTKASTVLVLMALRYTMWNTLLSLFVLEARALTPWVDKDYRPVAGEGGILLDAPWKKHWAIGVLWIVSEAFIIATTVWVGVSLQNRTRVGARLLHMCLEPSLMRAIVGAVGGMFLVHQVSSLVLIWLGFRQLDRKSYDVFRWIHVKMHYHKIQVLVVGTFLVLSVLLLSTGAGESCNSTITVLLGLLPAQVAMTVLGIVNGYLMTPVEVNGKTLNMNHQVSWVENGSVRGSQKTEKREYEFSYEIAIKLWYWSLLAYRIQSSDPNVTIEVAKGLYGLEDHTVIPIASSDVVAVVAWNTQTIVISFRGTSSKQNLKSDIKAFRVAHPPVRGHLLKCTRPLVHKGFLNAWCQSGLNHRVVNRVIQIVHGGTFNITTGQVLLTGHSMGGALALLASMDIARYCGISPHQLVCYTFGGPRVGNHAFRSEYNATVPNTWQVVNENDLVPGLPSFGPFFAHVGKRVLIDYAGNIIVRPLFVENKLHRYFLYLTASQSMTQHLMRNYMRSLMAIAQAQFIKRKGSPEAMESLRELFMKEEFHRLHDTLGLSSRRLEYLHRKGTVAWGTDASRHSPRELLARTLSIPETSQEQGADVTIGMIEELWHNRSNEPS